MTRFTITALTCWAAIILTIPVVYRAETMRIVGGALVAGGRFVLLAGYWIMGSAG